MFDGVVDGVVASLKDNSLVGNMERDCGQHFWRKFFIFWLVFLVVWNFTKVPYYIQFDANGDDPYEVGGITGSINMIHWFDGFDSSRLHSPACNFLLVHISFGSTVLIMMALTLVKTTWRRKYGKWFFTFAILLGVHTIPAALGMNQFPLRVLFTFACVYVIVSALFGFRTLKHYDEDPIKSEKHLLIEYILITIGAYGAGFAEFTVLFFKIKHRLENGEWRSYPNYPDPKFGHSLYDQLPEKVGMTIFFVWFAVFWFFWPIKLLGIDTRVPAVEAQKNKEGVTDETTALMT
uniref:Uncharacterized protein n=1 Tax=Trieres chinensis TaxID=1514140 RepID=A0A7S2EHE4_TRICV|eukprot:CAMPEP_0183295446 /NCGR_PEP_ID=MMETSP0160_2-20130417/3399_1 /TAXON_ID=2839 ORGANISM="Odontella Sinensis, Strain Grunow 1884" /NCGR_SAMPLE_ID=MMETSP0160_2 /ASSEMBLY_ACC=CAM_ASM_000250 /LENGTH=291 /DNA_ID=CAMNT_0025456933 /DNA_START=83 /DNA_END=958 /DNA_ORIENTATION=+